MAARTLPRVLLLGRPNVGKSTLFNRLLGRRLAMTHGAPHTTRDVLVGSYDGPEGAFELWDAAGFLDEPEDTLQTAVKRGLETAAAAADAVLLVLDARAGLLPGDLELAAFVRRLRKPVIPVVNKADGRAADDVGADFFALGFDVPPVVVSAKEGRNCAEVAAAIVAVVGAVEAPASGNEAVKVAIVGRPNVGKSSLLNSLAGAPRVVVHERPGTTRDAVDVALTYENREYVFVDTAGIRRRTRAKDDLEEWSLAKAFAVIQRAAVAVLVLDGVEGPTAQDAKIASYVDENGRGLLIFLNKTDLLPGGAAAYAESLARVREELAFTPYAPVIAGSAREGFDSAAFYATLDEACINHRRRIPTGELNRFLRETAGGRAFRVGSKEIKIRYAAQVQAEPPTFHLFVNTAETPPPAYERFLGNRLRDGFELVGTPIRLVWRLRRRGDDKKR